MTHRDKLLIIATLEVLAQMGSTLLLGIDHLRAGVRLKTMPPARSTEIAEALRWTEDRGLIVSQDDDFGDSKYRITDTGRSWLKEHA